MKTSHFSQFVLDIFVFCITTFITALINGTEKVTGKKKKKSKFLDSPPDSLKLIKELSFLQRYLQSALLL